MDKESITIALMKESRLEHLGLHKCKWFWWQNPDNPTSWRLTKAGHEAMVDIGIPPLLHTVKNSMSHNKTYLMLEKYFTSPFYIQRIDRIVFFGGNDSIMLTLLDNNLDQYIENFQR